MTRGLNDRTGDQHASGRSASRRDFFSGALALGASNFAALPDVVGAEPAKGSASVNPRLYSFVGGQLGGWSVVSAKAVVGDPLPAIDRVDFVTGSVAVMPEGAKWVLRGVTSNARYTTQSEKDSLVKKQSALGRPDCTL